MPLALERFDLRGYDLVVSSESGPAKGVHHGSNTRHVCYCHTPMRYLWDLYPAYLHEWTRSRIKRAVMAPVRRTIFACGISRQRREWMNSSPTATMSAGESGKRIGAKRRVIHPPVAVETFRCEPAEDYYLIVSELVAYKRIDIAVRHSRKPGVSFASSATGRSSRGCAKSPRRISNSADGFPMRNLRVLYARCRAFLMPGEEDFGITASKPSRAAKR